MNRRDFVENTIFGGLLASLAGFFGLELPDGPENGGNRPDLPSDSGHVRVVGPRDGGIEVEMAVQKRYPVGATDMKAAGLPDPSLNQTITTERFVVSSVQEFEAKYMARAGAEPSDRDYWRVANALGVDPV